MTGVDPAEIIATVNRRCDVLRALEDGPLEKPTLETRLAVSRSTIDRGIRELEETGLVTRDDEGYRRSLPGRIALEEFERFRSRLEGLGESAPLLGELDATAALDGALLDGARVVGSTRTSPGRPVEALYDVVDRADRVRAVGLAVHPRQVHVYSRRVAEEGMQAALVLTEDAIERLVADYRESFDVALDNDLVQFWRVDEALPYSLTLADSGEETHVGVLVYAGESIQGCILNDGDRAVAWGEERFETLRERAEPVG
jgi:predicted transcriptional regulator